MPDPIHDGDLHLALEGTRQLLYQFAESSRQSAEALASTESDPARAQALRQMGDDAQALWEHLEQTYLKKLEKCTTDLARMRLQTRMGQLALRLLERLEPDFTALDLCKAVLDDLMEDTGALRGFLVLTRDGGEEVEIVAAREFNSLDLDADEYNVSRSLLEPCLKGGRSLRIDEAQNDKRFSAETSIVSEGLRSALVVPLVFAGQVVGAIYLANNAIGGAFSAEDEDLLGAFGSILAANIQSLLHSTDLKDEKAKILDELRSQYRFHELIGQSPAIQKLLSTIAQIADTDATVLIQGESGTGKELVARALHFNSSRVKGPFVVINCAALPETLLESELFGHEKGAFTGAISRKLGRFEQANGGTIFLDEISSMPPALQAKLLRVLQEREFQRLGDLKTIHVNVRVIAATNQPLEKLVGNGSFREDLYYRLNVLPLHLPPLRERPEDIPLLVEYFLARYTTGTPKEGLEITPEVVQALESCKFPGNVRELQNLIQRLILFCRTDLIKLEDLPESLRSGNPSMSVTKLPANRLLRTVPQSNAELKKQKEKLRVLFKSYTADLETRFAEAAVSRTGGNISKAAKETGMNRVQLHSLLRRKRQAADGSSPS